MYIHEAMKIALNEDKEIALPTDESCENNGYHLRLKPNGNNFILLEYYGYIRTIDHFALSTYELIRNDWMVLN